MTSPASEMVFQKLDSLEEYVLVSQDEPCIEARRRSGRTWISNIGRSGETITIHGAAISVDSIYSSARLAKLPSRASFALQRADGDGERVPVCAG